MEAGPRDDEEPLAMNAFVRAFNRLMCVLFLLSVVVQWNDPDPLRWVAIYGAAFVVSTIVALRGRVPIAAPLAVMVVALTWALMSLGAGPAADAYSHMFDAWEMKSAPVEEAREASGLLIVAAWMFVLVVAQRFGEGKYR